MSGDETGVIRVTEADVRAMAERGELQLSEAEKTRARDRWDDYLFYWPEAMIRGYLPWEASRAALELLDCNDSMVEGGRPRLPVVRWFWRVTLAAPDAPVEERKKAAGILAACEAMEFPLPDDLRRVERFLHKASWRREPGLSDELVKDLARLPMSFPGDAEPIKEFNFPEFMERMAAPPPKKR